MPLFSSHSDVCVRAVTGSGKTLAFLLPVLSILLRLPGPLHPHRTYALIISPTRELALQTAAVIASFLPHLPVTVSSSCLIGGNTASASSTPAVSSHIITATPGRLQHALLSCQLSVSELEVLVLDEADRLLDLGFASSVGAIVSRLPKQRRTGLFSATLTGEVKELMKKVAMRNPVIVDVSVERRPDSDSSAVQSGRKTEQGQPQQQQVTPRGLLNYYHVLGADEKLTYLGRFLLHHRHHKSIVFLLTCACVDYFHRLLTTLPTAPPPAGTSADASASLSSLSSLTCIALHGQMPQKKRLAAYRAFRSASCAVLICTDVAARGVDIPEVDWIVQYDAPLEPSVFIHRIGRTARMGREGRSLLLLSQHEDAYIPYLHRLHVPITAFAPSPPIPASLLPASLSSFIKQLALQDRAVFLSAQHAVTSFLRAYKEHSLPLIFSLRELQCERLAEGYGLLMFPLLPDLRWLNVRYDSGVNVKASELRFKDAAKEERRQQEEDEKRRVRRHEQEEREESERERRKQKQLLSRPAAVRERRRLKRPRAQLEKEWTELQREANLIKKLKQKKITKKQLDDALDALDSDGEGEEDQQDAAGSEQEAAEEV